MSARGLVLRAGGVSRLVAPRALATLAGLALGLALAMLVSIALGSTWIPPERVLAALLGAGETTDALIVGQFRAPRAVQAALAGACLGVAGFLLQRATRNPLAAPSVLGIVDGAGLGVILFLTLFSNDSNALTVSIHWQPLAAALGGLALVALVFALGARELAQPVRLILYGVALAALAKAATTTLMITGPIYRTSQALHWLAGSVHSAVWGEVALAAAIAAPLALAVALIARRLDALDLDGDSARGVGLPLLATRAGAIVLAAGLTATAIAFAGGIGFVGLVAPHLARLLTGRAAGPGLLGSALVGALMVVGADLVVRVLFAPTEVPAGAVTALVGAPYLLYLLTRRSRADG
jgi:iron complex transport system permease protein